MRTIIFYPLYALALLSCPLHASQTDWGNNTSGSGNLYASILLDFSQQSQMDLRSRMDASEIRDRFQDENDVQSLLDAVEDFTPEEFQRILDWMKKFKIWDMCQNGRRIILLFQSINNTLEEKRPEILAWIGTPEVIAKCQNWDDILYLLETAKTYSAEERLRIVNWMKASGIWEVCQNWREIASIFDVVDGFIIFDAVDDLTIEECQKIVNWMKSSGIWDMCQNGYEIASIFDAVDSLAIEECQVLLLWMKASEIMHKCQNGKEFSSLFETVRTFSVDEAQEIVNWMKASRVWNMCQNGREANALFKAIKNLPATKRWNILEWAKTSGIMRKCQNVDEICALLETVAKLDMKQVQTTLKWMKTSGAWIQCQNGTHIRCFLLLFGDLKKAFEILEGSLIRACLTEKAHWEKFLNWHAALNYEPAKAILNKDQNLPEFDENLDFYIFCHAFYEPNDAVKNVIKDMTLNGDRSPENLLRFIAQLIGENHAFFQECLNWALERTLPNIPNDFLSVYQEMIRKRAATAQHNPILSEGVLLNLDLTRETRPVDLIPMPVSVWDQLFVGLGEAIEQERVNLVEIFGPNVSWDDVRALRNEPSLRNMLDSENSSTAHQDVDSYSRMLRAILKHIQDTDDMNIFGNLLANLRTCKAGQLNSILHSYTLIKNGEILDEHVLYSERFKEKLMIFFKRNLHRLGEICLRRVVRDITDKKDFSGEYYVRNIIGPEVGLMLESEKPRIDMEAQSVDKALRAVDTTKQKLLDMFYMYYNVENVTTSIQDLLDAQGSGSQPKRNPMKSIINNYLNEAWDEDKNGFNPELITFNGKNEPVGFTQEAVKRLLVKMGFLIEHPTETIGSVEGCSSL